MRVFLIFTVPPARSIPPPLVAELLESVLLRMKEDYDGAEPTASSVSVLNLIVLSHLVDDRTWTDRIERTLRFFGARLEQLGRAVPMMAAALSVYTAGVQQIVIDAVDGEHFTPDTVYAHTGKLRVTITNQSVLPHNFTVPSLGVQSQTIFAGRSMSVSVDLKASGVYPFLCTFHQHDGMTGQLIVADAPAAG